jgi:hypothetical protein
LARRLFAADPAKVPEKLAQEARERDQASGGIKRPGRPREVAPSP